MTYKPSLKCPRCGHKHTTDVLSIVGLPVEVCSECALRFTEFVFDAYKGEQTNPLPFTAENGEDVTT